MKNFNEIRWCKTEELSSKSFRCWNCGKEISANRGYYSLFENSNYLSNGKIYICHLCSAPNIFDYYDNPVIGAPIGDSVKYLPQDVECIYEEARNCMGIGAYTATIMLLRKILMAVAVDDGADKGATFKEYLEYLCKEKLIHKKQTKQAEKVKDLGNDANHKIECRTKEEAEMLLNFVQQFLITNYEFADRDDD